MASDGGASGGGGGGGGGDESLPSLPSPRNRVKFLCSHGGKILPRAVDGSLKYVGGETRVVAVPRDINFSELMKKLGTMYEGDFVLKYQLIPEDLESLVSVRTDEDLKHMLEEYNRQENEGNPKLRTFLFPSNPVIVENQPSTMDPQAVEQRYIDAINGIVRTTGNWKLPPINSSRSSFSISSACSSPKSTSPDSITIDSLPHELILTEGYQNSRLSMPKVQSSPSLCSFNGFHNQSSSSSHHFYQHPHHFHPNNQQHHSYNYQTHRTPSASFTQADICRPQMGHSQNPSYSRCHSTSRSLLGIGNFNKYGYFDESVYGFRRPKKAGSLPHSPKKNKITERKGSVDNVDQIDQ